MATENVDVLRWTFEREPTVRCEVGVDFVSPPHLPHVFQLDQAVEVKEGLEPKRETQTLATITFQNYFRMFEKLSGMTGTALTEAGEFHKIYDLDVVSIPTNLPIARDDAPALASLCRGVALVRSAR